ncbi:MAG: CotH kinase family protein [bacterium]|nr:CotH kinase family protein [bacterium]
MQKIRRRAARRPFRRGARLAAAGVFVLPLLSFTQVRLDSTDLPLVMIDTGGRTVPAGRKISGRMKIVDHGPGRMNRPADAATGYDGAIGIEIRGHHSSTFPQKPYDVETRDDAGNNRNAPLLGMPAENDWILLSNYNDKSFLRNWIAFDLYRRMGHYAPRAVLCEVLLNSAYRGVYVFAEKIKRDRRRVDIAELDPDKGSGDALTGGYIFKVDYHDESNSWMSDFPPMNYPNRRVYYVYVYPKPELITENQADYLRRFVSDAEDAVYGGGFADPRTGFRKFLDIPSFIDYFILSEVSRNVDAYKKSRFFHKDSDSRNGLLRAGPPWDFDWAWKNILECVYSATDGSGWSFLTNDCNPDNNAPDWYLGLLQDGGFTEDLIRRYRDLRSGILDPDRICVVIDSMAALVSSAQGRHFRMWPIAGPNPAPEVESPSRTYAEETGRLKNWIRLRIAWLDDHIEDLRGWVTEEAGVSAGSRPPAGGARLFPNPASDRFAVSADRPLRRIRLFDLLGRRVYDSGAVFCGRDASVPVRGLPSGIYFAVLDLEGGATVVVRQTIGTFGDR